MKTELFDFDLPEHLIAQEPLPQRDQARLLHVQCDTLADQHIYDLPELLGSQDVLVFNDTKVIPARLYGQRDAVAVEVLLHKQEGVLRWRAFAKPAKRLKPGQVIAFQAGLEAEVLAKYDSGEVALAFAVNGKRDNDAAFWEALHRIGQMPLPPYIARPTGTSADDAARYQTVYGRHEGSVAAPTAGLHFTPELLERLQQAGVEQHYITLHVGGGTFLPVKAEDTDGHQMHSEYAIIDEATANALNEAKAAGKRITAVGTTSLRTLEAASYQTPGRVQPFRDETEIFITPGYAFRFVDRLLTNFHLPKSTLFMLVAAFSGLERMKAAYSHAIDQRYRFYSYGDGCLLERCP